MKNRFEYGDVVEARYIEQSEITYKGNELIEALPPLYTVSQINELLSRSIPFSAKERDEDIEYRLEAISRVKDYFFVMDKHIDIARKIDIAMKQSYSNKSLPDPSTLYHQYYKFDEVDKGNMSDRKECTGHAINTTKPTMDGFSIYGTSGGGKSLAVNNILSFYPQLIIHRRFKGQAVVIKQIPYVKIDCTYNGSVKGLYRKFFNRIDEIVGTNYDRKTRRMSIPDMEIAMRKVVFKHRVGCIVIDEIQHIVNARNESYALINALVTIENEMNVPIIFIGTYKAVDVLTKAFRLARRTGGSGAIDWARMENDEDFSLFIKYIWKYQWVRKPVELNHEIINAFYKCTMGITDRVVKLFMLSQMAAITSEVEMVNSEVLISVAEEMMPLTDRYVRALRENDLETLSKFEDVMYVDMSKIVENKYKANMDREKLNQIRVSDNEKKRLKTEELFNELLVFAFKIDPEEKRAKQIVRYVLGKAEQERYEKSDLHREVADFIVNKKKVPKLTRRKKEIPSVESFKTINVDGVSI